MSRLGPDDLDDLDPIDLDRLAIDGEYRRAVMLRLRTEAKEESAASTPEQPAPDLPKTRED